MKTLSFSLLAFIVAVFFFSCDPGSDPPSPPPPPPPVPGNCLLSKITDSLNTTDTVNYYYNTNQQVIKFKTRYGGGSPNNGYVDTFIYNNTLLTGSHYNIGQSLFANPYAKTDYIFSGTTLTKSNYFLGNTNQVSYCNYTFDNQGRISTVQQVALQPGLGATSHSTRYEYDANSNLVKIYYYDPFNPQEFVCTELSGYDNKPSPFYKMPWVFDYDFYIYSSPNLSKNNCGRITTYTLRSDGTRQLNADISYIYTYDTNDRIIKRRAFDNSRNVNAKTEIFSYQCF